MLSKIHHVPRAALRCHLVASRYSVRLHARKQRLVRSSRHRRPQWRLRSVQSECSFFLIYIVPLLVALADSAAALI